MPPRPLRSSSRGLLRVPRSKIKYGDRCFSVCAPTLLNDHLRLATDLCSFLKKGDTCFTSLFVRFTLFAMLDLIFSFLFRMIFLVFRGSCKLDVQHIRTFGSCALY